MLVPNQISFLINHRSPPPSSIHFKQVTDWDAQINNYWTYNLIGAVCQGRYNVKLNHKVLMTNKIYLVCTMVLNAFTTVGVPLNPNDYGSTK